MTSQDALEVFFSYSHLDRDLRAKLATHLSVLKRREVIRTWFDGEIPAGSEFAPAISERLNAADVILLLISPDFIASDFCWSVEMKRAMERHETGEARVIPILLRPVDDWESTPFGKLKALPTDGLAATEWPNLDTAFRDAAAGIRQSIEDLAARRAGAPSSAPPLRVVLLIGHSVADPLPQAVEMAQTTVRDFQDSGLAVELRVDQATMASFEREAEEGCDLFIYYGHGTDDGQLSWADGRKSCADLSRPSLDAFWRDLGAALIFACSGDRFARDLPCPWIAFSQPILTQAPKGFLHALIPALAEEDLPAAVERARKSCAREMRSSFTDVMRFSETPLPPLRPGSGSARLRRLSPALAKSHRLDFGSLRTEDHLYPDHDPFVGRVPDLESLLRLPSPHDDQPLQRVVWVHGTAGMGKSALLRQFATFVRDLVFREEDELVYLIHLHCYRYTQREEVIAALCSRAADLYRLDPPPATLESLFAALESRFGTRGTHVWVLDDLTYLSKQPASTEEAGRLVFELRDLANSSSLRWQLVISSRRPGPQHFEPIEVGPLDLPDALRLARQVWFSGHHGLSVLEHEITFGAAQLFRVVQSTAQYKRALLLALDRGMTYRAYADGLSEGASLDARDHLEAAQRMLAFEVRQLGELEEKHGFAYREFLGIYYPLIARAASFTQAELADWFGDRLLAADARSRTQTFANGLAYLARLGFTFLENRAGEQIFSMPPNQRWSMRALSDGHAELPAAVPRRGARQRLSLAQEGLERGDLSALGDLLAMAGDYQNDLDDPASAAAVYSSMLLQSQLARTDPREEMRILEKIVELDNGWRSSYPLDEAEASEHVASALFNKGFRLGALGRSEEAIAVYDLVEARYGARQEPALAEKVAMALHNKGVTLVALGLSEEEIAVYDLMEARYGARQEPALAEKVALALFNKGVRLGALGRSEEEIAVYDLVEARYGARQEPALAEKAAKVLLNKGVRLGAQGRSEEEIAVYDLVEARYGARQEPALAEQVALALVNKGVRLGELDRSEEAIAVYDLVEARYGARQEPALTEKVALALVNKGVLLGALGRSEEEIEVYDLVEARYGARQKPALAEQVALALVNKGVRLGELGRSEEEIEVYDLVEARYGARQEPALAEKVALALVGKGVRLGELDRSEEAIAVYDLVEARYGARQEPALAEKVALALVGKGVRLGELDRSEEAIAVYDLMEARYGARQEPALAEKVVLALVGKGVRLGELDRSEEAIAVYDLVEARYGARQEPALAEQVASALGSKGWRLYELGAYEASVASSRAALARSPGETFVRCNLALALLHLGKLDDAKATYEEALKEMTSPEELDEMALQDLDAALARQPDLPGAREIREMLGSRKWS